MSSSTPRVTLGGGLLDAELFQAGGISEIGKLVAVVIDVLNADAVQLAAEPTQPSMMSSL